MMNVRFVIVVATVSALAIVSVAALTSGADQDSTVLSALGATLAALAALGLALLVRAVVVSERRGE